MSPALCIKISSRAEASLSPGNFLNRKQLPSVYTLHYTEDKYLFIYLFIYLVGTLSAFKIKVEPANIL